jgi:tape measure domain-containing protein
MAKKIEELVVELGITGLEKVDKLKGAFRELNKVTDLTDKEIRGIRERLLEFGATAGNTQQVNKALTDAFKGLIGEARKGSAVWTQLNRDLQGFRQEAALTDSQLDQLAQGIVAESRAHAQSETSIRGHIKALQDLRAQSVLGGQVNRQLGESIQQLTTRLDDATAGSRRHFSALTQALAVRPDAVLRQWQAYTQVLNDVRANAEEAAAAQRRLTALAGAPRITARRAVTARAEIQADPAYQSRFGLEGRSLEAMPDVPAALSLRLRELQEDLNSTARSTNVYVSTLVEMARIQREASAATQGFAARLREQLQAGQIAPSQRNLQEVIGALRREMIELDQTTEEGSRQYAENARQADVLERQLRDLANSYRTVADAAGQAATAEQNAANARIRGNYLNRSMMRAQEQAFAGFAEGVRQAAAATPLMLPAAGQTTARGTGQAISGGARRLAGQVESTFGEAQFRNPRAVAFMGREGLPSAAVGQPAAVGTTPDAYAAQAAAARAAAADLTQYRAAIDKASQANNGSVNSMQRLRESLIAMRSAIPSTDAEFGKLTKRVQALDAQIEKTQIRGRRGLGAMGATQAAGAVISGGIFGGPEGAIGGIAGTIAGGVPGAFAGAAAGAQIGIMRQQLGAMAQFTAEIDKQRIALRSVVGSQQDYQQALQFIDATSRRAAIPHDQLTTQFTQLAASVIGAGGSVDIAERAFRGMAAGIRGTGGSLEAMKAAMLATSQVFSKGKVSAEEIRQQIGERLPGAFTTFATAIGKTPAMLDKMLQKGEVTLDDFMLLIEELIRTYEPSMDRIAASSQAAGDRMQVTFARIREAIGRELQPVGAQFQESIVKAVSASEPAIIAFSQNFAAMARVVVDNMDGIAKALEIILAFGAVTGVAVAFANLSAIFNAFSGIVVALTLKFAQLTAVMLANPWALAVAGVAALGIAVGKVVFEQNALNVETEKYINLAKKMPSADIAAEIGKVQDELRQARKEMEEAKSGGGFSTDLLGLNIKELMKSEGSIDRIEKKLKNLERTYRTKLQIEAIFAGQQGIPEGYKIVNGRLAYQVGNTWVDAETGQPVKKKGAGFGSGGADDENAAKQRASSMLQAIEQRENSIAQARIQLEERAREIRKQAIEQARQLEERFADQRLQREREVAAARRQLAGIEENIGFEMQAINIAAQGGDPEMVRIQQRMAEAARQRDEERITREQQLLDEQTERSKAIENLKKTTADSINEANARYAKAIGEAQREYARAVARIIEEGTGRAGQRLEAAGRLAAALLQQATAKQSFLAATGASVVPSSKGFVVGGVEYSAAELVATAQLTGGAAATAAKDFVASTAAIRQAERALASLPTATAIAGPAIRSISVNTSDLTARLNQSAGALANLGEEFKNISQNIAQRKFFQEFLSQAGQQTQGAFQSMRSMQQDLARSSGVLGLRESGAGREQAEQTFDVRKQFENALAGLKQAYASAFAEAETVGEKLALEEAFVSISANLARAEEQAISFVDAINNIPTDIQLRVAVQDIKDELTALANPANQIIGAATAIGDAFGNSFKGLISGAMSAKQALAGFFQSVADYFLDMASKMIAKWIVMKLIGLVGGMFPGASGQGLSNLNAPATINNPLGVLNANGNAFAQNGIVPYAKGGVVNRPTMFKFANGGAMQNGVMGEAGPEAIMPLKRGADGKLGVTARMDGAMSRYRRPPGTMAAAADGMAATEGAAPAAVNGAIDVRYTVERINSVDYVTADQFQQGMQQAAMQGAQRGEQMVLRKLQQSPSTRRRVGVS